jgi:mono/diheme cytochrome c family protein
MSQNALSRPNFTVLERPPCPKCYGPMTLSDVTSGSAGDTRTFECVMCNRTEKVHRRDQKMRNGIGISRFLILASLVLLPVGALAQPLAGDAASGRKTATTLCGTCHQVIGGEGRDSPASFVDIANMTSTTALSLKVFLRSSHKEMPNLIIDNSDTDDLIAYILSLKKRFAQTRQ